MNKLKSIVLLSIFTLLMPSCNKPASSSFVSSENSIENSSSNEPSISSSSEEPSICKHVNLYGGVIKEPTIIQSGLIKDKCLD